MLGDLYQQQKQTIFTGDGTTTSVSTALETPVTAAGTITDTSGDLTGTINSTGIVSGTGYLASGTVDFATGSIQLTFGTAPPNGDIVTALYDQVAPYRCSWSAIGDPTNWPVPLTQAAYAAQSGQNDLDVDYGPVMFIAGYPLYGLIFQSFGITKASYIGGNVVFSWAQYEFKRGVIAHGAAIRVGPLVYYLSDEGFFYTDGANVVPIGTASNNSAGIDRWFWENVNIAALEAIRTGYDSQKRCIFFAIPTGVNTLPDTLLTYNTLAQQWTRAAISCQTLWTSNNATIGDPATLQLLGLMDQTNTPNMLTGVTMSGYIESCDIWFNDGQRRLISGARPHVASTDTPSVVVGSRNALTDPVAYSVSGTPDTFSRIAPILQSGIYNRVRVSSGAATNLQGATLYMETEGGI
jgi:hypothetical protein